MPQEAAMATDIQSHLNFVPDNAPRTTITQLDELYARLSDKQDVTIHDIRNVGTDFQLDVHGFQFYEHPLPPIQSYTKESIEEHLYEDTIRFLKQNLNASRVDIFEHVHRNAHDDTISEKTGKRGPAYVVHVDHAEEGAKKVLRELLPADEVNRLTKTRWALINVWRPLETVEKDPLALCDATSAAHDDLVQFTVDFFDESAGPKENRVDVQWSVIFGKYSPNQKWYYKSRMTPNDLVCFKIFDTKNDNDTWCMHSSFPDPKTTNNPKPRKSIEIRCFVFFEDEPLG